MRINIIVPCLNRWDRVRINRKSWMKLTQHDARLFIITYDFDADVQKFDEAERTFVLHGFQHFNGPIARNTCAVNSLRVRPCDYLFFCDADVGIINPDLFDSFIGDGVGDLCNHDKKPNLDPTLCGTNLVRAEHFRRVRGYDERIHGYGCDDRNFYRRLIETGSKRLTWDWRKVYHIPHAHATRTVNYPIKDMATGMKVQEQFNRPPLYSPYGEAWADTFGKARVTEL